MFNFFKKKNKEVIENSLTKIAALLIHVAKIDENYTKKERDNDCKRLRCRYYK